MKDTWDRHYRRVFTCTNLLFYSYMCRLLHLQHSSSRWVIHQVQTQTYLVQEANDKVIIYLMKMAGNIILTRKQLEKMTNDQLINFAMKLKKIIINKQTELLNNSKEFREKPYTSILTPNLMNLKKKTYQEWPKALSSRKNWINFYRDYLFKIN